MKYTRARAERLYNIFVTAIEGSTRGAEADLDTIGCDAVLQAALLGEVAFG